MVARSEPLGVGAYGQPVNVNIADSTTSTNEAAVDSFGNLSTRSGIVNPTTGAVSGAAAGAADNISGATVQAAAIAGVDAFGLIDRVRVEGGALSTTSSDPLWLILKELQLMNTLLAEGLNVPIDLAAYRNDTTLDPTIN